MIVIEKQLILKTFWFLRIYSSYRRLFMGIWSFYSNKIVSNLLEKGNNCGL